MRRTAFASVSLYPFTVEVRVVTAPVYGLLNKASSWLKSPAQAQELLIRGGEIVILFI